MEHTQRARLREHAKREIQGRFFIHRVGRWRLTRLVYTQVGWDRERHAPICKWEATFSNGSFLRHHMSKWLLWALIRGRFNFPRARLREHARR
jgi:hypothetical protein